MDNHLAKIDVDMSICRLDRRLAASIFIALPTGFSFHIIRLRTFRRQSGVGNGRKFIQFRSSCANLNKKSNKYKIQHKCRYITY